MTTGEAIKEINNAADEIVRHWAIENPTVSEREEGETRVEAFEMAVKMLSCGKTTDDDVNTMRLLFNAVIGDLCNQSRYNDAEEMEGIRDRLIKRLLEKNKVYEWIPVSERLPEKTGIYLISIGDLVTSKSFDGHNFRTESAVRFIPDAWMPLPEPYKESKTD